MMTCAPRPQQIRQDRILDEAHVSEDRLRLMRLFTISVSTAMRYVAAARPGKTGDPLR
jgi:hypothetical protein